MKIQILDKAKKKKIVEELKPLGIHKIPQLLIKTGSENIRAYTGSLSNEEIYELYRALPIEGIGLYSIKEIVDKRNGQKEIRLTIDGAHMYSNQLQNRKIFLNLEQEANWFRGKEIELNEDQKNSLETDKCFVIVVSKESSDIIGTGKIGSEKEILYNYLPKERRRKNN